MSVFRENIVPARSVSVRHVGWWRVLMMLLIGSWMSGLSAQTFSIEGQLITGGGGVSSNEQFSVAGVIGQYDVAKLSGAEFTLEEGFLSQEISTRVPGGPTLVARQSGSMIVITWAADGGAYVLQEASDLGGFAGAWSNSKGIPNLVNGQWVITLSAQAGRRFFRLIANPPSLVVRLVGASIEVAWRSGAGSAVLQETTRLDGVIGWSTVEAAPTLIRGQWVISLPLRSGDRFFRLRWP